MGDFFVERAGLVILWATMAMIVVVVHMIISISVKRERRLHGWLMLSCLGGLELTIAALCSKRTCVDSSSPAKSCPYSS